MAAILLRVSPRCESSFSCRRRYAESFERASERARARTRTFTCPLAIIAARRSLLVVSLPRHSRVRVRFLRARVLRPLLACFRTSPLRFFVLFSASSSSAHAPSFMFCHTHLCCCCHRYCCVIASARARFVSRRAPLEFFFPLSRLIFTAQAQQLKSA